MRKAVIDLGTNTFHLYIAEVDHGAINEVHKEQVAVTLGDGGINQGKITDEAFERGLAALATFRRLLDEFACEDVKAYATSAIRSAQNGEAFKAAALDNCGINIQIIDGQQEAQFIYKGVAATLEPEPGRHLVMDIGGGSVEFILGDNAGYRWSQSFDIGCARLVEKFHQDDPIPEASITDLYEYLDEELKELREVCAAFPPHVLVGSAGSFESLMTLNEDLFGRKSAPVSDQCYRIDLEEYYELHELLILSTEQERRNMEGLADYRVRMMVVASILIAYVLETYSIDRMQCSMYSLKEGALLTE